MDNIIEDFEKQKDNLFSFKEMLLTLFPTIIKGNNKELVIHQISARVKEKISLEGKIKRKGGKYNTLSDITDLVGVRIITYLESEVDSIADIIKSEFDIDKDNSVDKRQHNTDTFGYKSLHYVVSISGNRSEMTEYKNYKGIKFEIQIRSILQHAWAEIEHDLGYKSNVGTPDPLKRSLSRVAALLEIADSEFDKFKKELMNYTEKIPVLIKNIPKDVDVNDVSLKSLSNTNKVLIEAKKVISQIDYFGITEYEKFNTIVPSLKFLGFDSIYKIEKDLDDKEIPYLKFVNLYVETLKNSPIIRLVDSRMGLAYFGHFIAAETQNYKKIRLYFEEFRISIGIIELERFVNLYKSSISID